jgi:hypothetical protein
MIWGTWIDPNFKFRAVDKEDILYEYFCYANSEQALRVRLENKNLSVESIWPYDFNDWKERAREATDKAIAAYQAGKKPINFNGKIWAELKWHLFELFHGKCAYCEGKPQAVAYGDVEHYRPKSKVDEDPDHPGYYWLAYDTSNLLPSCGPCNQTRGKMTHFPVRGTHAHSASELAGEEALLLNPYNRQANPFQHLEFNALGEAMPRNGSLYGEQSRRWYHLNRPGLSEARRDAISRVERDWHVLTGIFSNQEIARKNFREDITLGLREYSAAQLWHLDRLGRSNSIAVR